MPSELISQILQTSLYPTEGAESYAFVPQSDTTDDDNGALGSFEITKNWFPENCKVVGLPAGVAFLDELVKSVLTLRPQYTFVLPPFISRRNLPDNLQRDYPRLDGWGICLKMLVGNLIPNSVFGVLLPQGFFLGESARAFREELFQEVKPSLVITDEELVTELGLPIHSRFKMGILIATNMLEPATPLRFFKMPGIEERIHRDVILKDLRHLLKITDGRTKYGYALSVPIPPEWVLSHDLYHPDMVQRQVDMENYGEVRTLSDIVDVSKGLITINNAHLLVPNEDGAETGVPLIEAADIRVNGTILVEETRYRIKDARQGHLRDGDICLRAINAKTDTLYVAEVNASMLPLVASQNIIILRPKPFIADEDRRFLIDYLRSQFAAELLRAKGVEINISVSQLRRLPIPFLDKPLRQSLQSLNDAVQQLDSWKNEAELQKSSLFKYSSAKEARINLLSNGRLLRRRIEAAKSVSDFSFLLRTQFPFPLAYRWRIVETSDANLEGYIQVLECAEALVSFLASITIMVSRFAGVRIGQLEPISDRISSGRGGTNMGDWVAILREVSDSRAFRTLPETTPFYEIFHVLKTEDANKALQWLKAHRDDNAHGRGPKGKSAVEKSLHEARGNLETLLQAADFLSEYPLRLVEETQRDSLAKVTTYKYRDLIGDHPLAHPNWATTLDNELEAESFYLIDQIGDLHLIRPLLTYHVCAECNTCRVFYLDSYDPRGQACIVKSLENGHTVRDPHLLGAFNQIGLLNTESHNNAS